MTCGYFGVPGRASDAGPLPPALPALGYLLGVIADEIVETAATAAEGLRSYERRQQADDVRRGLERLRERVERALELLK